MTRPHMLPPAAVIEEKRQRGLAASIAAKQDAESKDGGQWWLYCDVPKFIEYLENLEAQRK